MNIDIIGSPCEWPESFSHLRELDNLLRCAVCFEFMNTAMSLPRCSHNYCTLCIRRYISYKTQCPTCAETVSDPELRNNRVLDEIIRVFKAVRSKLVEVVNNCSLPDTKRQQTSSVKIPLSTSCFPKKVIPKAKKTWRKTLHAKKTIHGNIKEFCTQKRTALDDSEDEAIKFKPGSHKKKQVIDSDNESDVIICESGDEDFKSSVSKSYKSSIKVGIDVACNEESEHESESDFSVIDTICTNRNETGRETTGNKSDSTSGLVNSAVRHDVEETNDVNCEMSPVKNLLDTDANCHQSGRDKIVNENHVCQGSTESPSHPPYRGLGCLQPKERNQDNLQPAEENIVPSTSRAESTQNKVCCPVCNVAIPERNINLHLDKCLSNSEKKEALRSAAPKRKPLPKLVYGLLSDKDLRKRLLDIGLPTQGDKKNLIKRHHEFTLLYNAQCDSLNPRTAEDIVRDMLRSEKRKGQLSFTTSLKGRLNIDKSASTEAIQVARRDYIKRHKGQFSDLIADIRKRSKQRKCSTVTRQSEQMDPIDVSSMSGPDQSDPNTTEINLGMKEATATTLGANRDGRVTGAIDLCEDSSETRSKPCPSETESQNTNPAVLTTAHLNSSVTQSPKAEHGQTGSERHFKMFSSPSEDLCTKSSLNSSPIDKYSDDESLTVPSCNLPEQTQDGNDDNSHDAADQSILELDLLSSTASKSVDLQKVPDESQVKSDEVLTDVGDFDLLASLSADDDDEDDCPSEEVDFIGLSMVKEMTCDEQQVSSGSSSCLLPCSQLPKSETSGTSNIASSTSTRSDVWREFLPESPVFNRRRSRLKRTADNSPSPTVKRKRVEIESDQDMHSSGNDVEPIGLDWQPSSLLSTGEEITSRSPECKEIPQNTSSILVEDPSNPAVVSKKTTLHPTVYVEPKAVLDEKQKLDLPKKLKRNTKKRQKQSTPDTPERRVTRSTANRT